MKKNKKRIATFLYVFVIVCTIFLSGCSLFNFLKSDEKKIEERIESFEKNYNNGDFEGVVECLTAKERSMIEAEMKIASALMGSLIGFDLPLSSLFSIGVGIHDGDYIRIALGEIKMTGSRTATADGVITIEPNREKLAICFYMVKEEDDWFIKDMTDVPQEENGKENDKFMGAIKAKTGKASRYQNDVEISSAGETVMFIFETNSTKNASWFFVNHASTFVEVTVYDEEKTLVEEFDCKSVSANNEIEISGLARNSIYYIEVGYKSSIKTGNFTFNLFESTD